MVSAVIADDEPLLRRELRETLADLWPGLEIVGEYADGAACLRAIEELRPDVAFLDIRMPKLSGLEVAERIQGECQIIFVTAYDEHAIAAFEKGAVDYVLKPIKHARLAATIRRLQERMTRVRTAAATAHGARLEWIQASIGNSLRFYRVDEIFYCRAEGKYTHIMTVDAEALIRRSISVLIKNLDPARFWKIHRGIVVNVEKIDCVVRDRDGAMLVRMRDGRGELPVSKPHQHQFRGM